MQNDHIDIGNILKERRKSVEESIRPISNAELKVLQESLFTDPLHPWAEPFRCFAEEHSGDVFYYATTSDQVQVVYCRAKEKGIWFRPGVGIGIIQPKALGILREIVDPQ